MTNIKHGLHLHPLYHTHSNMMRRCYNEENKSYKYYGKKGITVYPEWHNIERFIDWAENNGYDKNLTINRVDNSKGYGPDNCNWISIEDQQRNRSNNIIVVIRDEKIALCKAAIKYGFKLYQLANRYKRGDRGERLIRPILGIGNSRQK